MFSTPMAYRVERVDGLSDEDYSLASSGIHGADDGADIAAILWLFQDDDEGIGCDDDIGEGALGEADDGAQSLGEFTLGDAFEDAVGDGDFAEIALLDALAGEIAAEHRGGVDQRFDIPAIVDGFEGVAHALGPEHALALAVFLVGE